MYATEFQTVIDEPYIKVPNYEEFKGHEVRVVFLDLNSTKVIEKDDKNNELDFIENLINNPIVLDADFKFDREEANAR
jgi:hypothetical protein